MDKLHRAIGKLVINLFMASLIAIGGYVGIKQLEGVHVVREPSRQYASAEQADEGCADGGGDYIGCLIGGGK